MKKVDSFIPFLVLIFTFLGLGVGAFAQEVLYYEPFSNGIPNSFQIKDKDSLKVHPSIDSSSIENFPFNGTWVPQLSFSNSEDTVVASSSRYNPPGISDDWLITPQIRIPDTGTYFLQWRAASFSLNLRDGYEVRISTTGDSIQDFIHRIFSIESESPLWKTRKVSLAEFAAGTIYIAFRHTSQDKFLLFLDDIYIADSIATVGSDPAILGSEFPNIYTRAPLGQLDTFFLSATISNLGNQASREPIGMSSTIYNPFPDKLLFEQELQGPTSSLDTFGIASFMGEAAFVPADTGLHIITYTLSSAEQDSLPTNGFTREVFENDIDFQAVEVSDSVMARDDGVFTSIWDEPVEEGNRSILGSVFDLRRPDILTSATAFLFPFKSNIGDELVAEVYNSSFERIGQSEPYTILQEDTTGAGIRVHFPFEQSVSLNPGPFMLALKGGEFLPMLMSKNVFFEERTLFTWDSLAQEGTWYTTEAIKPLIDSARALSSEGRGPFDEQRVLGLRANLAGCATLNGELIVTNDDGSSNGSIAVIPSGGTGPYTYAWNDGQNRPETDSSLTSLREGRYSVTITDNKGCETLLLGQVELATHRRDPLDLGFNGFSVFPNPVRSNLNIEFSLDKPDDIQVSLMDIQGRVLKHHLYRHILTFEGQIPTSDFSAGIYMLQIQSSRGILYRRLVLRGGEIE